MIVVASAGAFWFLALVIFNGAKPNARVDNAVEDPKEHHRSQDLRHLLRLRGPARDASEHTIEACVDWR